MPAHPGPHLTATEARELCRDAARRLRANPNDPTVEYDLAPLIDHPSDAVALDAMWLLLVGRPRDRHEARLYNRPAP